VILLALGVTVTWSFSHVQVADPHVATLAKKAEQFDSLQREAEVQPVTAVVLALSKWRLGDYGHARKNFELGRAQAPLESVHLIDDIIRSAESQGDNSVDALKGARWEFLRYPMIWERAQSSPELRKYCCEHNYTIIGASGSKEAVEKELQKARRKFPNSELGAPVGKNPAWALVLDAFLTCEEAQNLAWKLYKEQGARPLITRWYSCPKYSCPTPNYSTPGVEGVTRLPDARIGARYEYRFPKSLVFLMNKDWGGPLPPGLELTEAGTIRGTPTTTQQEPFTFVLQFIDGPYSDDRPIRMYSIRVAPAIPRAPRL